VDLKVHSAPGLYKYLLNDLIPTIVCSEQINNVLDLGAGSGAFENLLLNNYPKWQIKAADLELFEYFMLRDKVRFKKINLNSDFADEIQDKFDLVFAIDVIEHLENPIKFLRNAARLLKDNGLLIITTPNIENVIGRLKFFIYGQVRHFELSYPEHLVPIHTTLFIKYIFHAGLQIRKHKYFPPNNRILFSSPVIRFIGTFLTIIFDKILKNVKKGETHIFVLERRV